MLEDVNSNILVSVRAQVMIRDESTEGWLPLAGGGLADVSIRKRTKLYPGTGSHEYLIYGQRISDQNVILSCVINQDLKYHKVMPTFHHWRTGRQKNGLTFQTAADARAFDKGILEAYNHLIDEMASSTGTTGPHPQKVIASEQLSIEDDVFMDLNLPVDVKNHGDSLMDTNGHQSEDLRVQQKGFVCKTTENRLNTDAVPLISSSIFISNASSSNNNPYVTLTTSITKPPATNENHPTKDAMEKETAVSTSLQEKDAKTPMKECRYCHEMYHEEWNQAGSCQTTRGSCYYYGMECIFCLPCARCVLSKLGPPVSQMDESATNTSTNDGHRHHARKRQICFVIISLLLPCLWCLPLQQLCCPTKSGGCSSCHKGKHKPTV